MLALDSTYNFGETNTDSLILDISIILGPEPALSGVYSVPLWGVTGQVCNRGEVILIVFARTDPRKTTRLCGHLLLARITPADGDNDYQHI